MQFIISILGTPLGYILYLCFLIAGNYGLSIILFTVVSKILLFPVSLWVQKNSVRMARLKPELDDIKRRYAGDKDKIDDEQMALFRREKYNPLSSIIPTLVQIPIIMGLIHVLNNPLLYLRVNDFNPYFLGLDLNHIPSITQPALSWIVAFLAITATFLMCVAQNTINPFQREQSAANKWGMTAAITIFASYFVFVVSLSLALYWGISNFLQILVMILCNMIYNPRKHIDQQIRAQKPHYSREEKVQMRQAERENKGREKADIKKFYATEDKQLVFISPSNGYYKYYKNFIAYILEHSDIVIHYITSDPNDQIFTANNPQIVPYYIGEKALISFMMKMDADMVVMTMPDLGHYHIKRSWVRKDIEYVFADHSMNSMHMVFREGSLDHYDTIFCVHAQYMDEIRASEKLYGTKEKKLIPVGYNLIDDLAAQYEAEANEAADAEGAPGANDDKKIILIAPSWQKDNILELCIDEILAQLLGRDYHIIVRPHPEFIKRFPDKMKEILQRYENYVGDDLTFETDFTSSTSIFTSDMLITDWSAIAIEFSYATLKPSLYINTPPKIMNPNYKNIPFVPLDIALRDLLGVSVDLNQLGTLADTVTDMFQRQGDFKAQILNTRDKYLFNLGHSGEAGGRYIIDRLSEQNPKKTVV